MKGIHLCSGFLLLVLMGFSAPVDPPEFKISMFDELAPLYPDTRIEKEITTYAVDVCRGSTAGVDILMTGLVPMEAVHLYQAFDQYEKDIRDYRKIKKDLLFALTGSTL